MQPQTVGLLSPFRVRTLRMMLGFELSASVGVWILVLAVQWTLTESGESAFTVSSVQFAASLPFFLLSLPIGAWAGYVGHRRLLVATSVALLVASMLLTVLQYMGLAITPILMTAVFVSGCGLASVAIVWQALLPTLATREMMTVVPAIDGAIFNGARAIGPVLGGALLAAWGATSTFALVTVLVLLCTVLAATQIPAQSGRADKTGSVRESVETSLRFIRHSRWTRRLLFRVIMFGLPASCLWALLPVVAYDMLGVTTFEFGVLSGAIGIGAVAGTVALMPLRARLSWNTFAAIGSAAYAVVLLGLVIVPWTAVVFVLLVIVGAAWVGVQSTWMIATHAVMPPWIKSRVIAFIMLTFQGSQAVGALAWGLLSDSVGLTLSIGAAAVAMAFSAIGLLRRGILPSESISPEPSGVRGPPTPMSDHDGRRIVVETTYVVHPDRASHFVGDIDRLRSSRLRLGALRWSIAQPTDSTDTYVEFCTFKNWSEYSAQETIRLTVPERLIRTTLAADLTQDPRVRILIHPSTV
ncbi:MFS transporter [Rhodococcoides kyotonense]|uniref:MFS-type transporter involved in bile tolerance, Atg22 family n=1 Tax=Rhodococcoides kyotonense TaxID=398843 RepID=A0A239H8C5_9NOCA|nr:MFS transporter [Rhodococcus kyotonensis]SNS77395.1 MFS-type transporter involved in bile tolerance, Atg22 family [Rhodococcus kyotonensis]